MKDIGEKVGGIKLRMAGAWLFRSRAPMEREDVKITMERQDIDNLELVQLISGTWTRDQLPLLKKKFMPWVGHVEGSPAFDPSCYIIVLGEGETASAFHWPDIKED